MLREMYGCLAPSKSPHEQKQSLFVLGKHHADAPIKGEQVYSFLCFHASLFGNALFISQRIECIKAIT